jgi:hypothetical protein
MTLANIVSSAASASQLHDSSDQEAIAAAAASHSEGVEKGRNMERGRISAIISADGVKGNAVVMEAAIDLAVKSPGMSAEDIVSFATAHVHSVPTQKTDMSLSSRITPDPLAGAVGGVSSREQRSTAWGTAMQRAGARKLHNS